MAMNFSAYVDESESKEEFVLGGHIATAEAWAAFSKDWEEMLPYAVRNDGGSFRFKMSEMAINSERLMRVPAFSNIIDKHVLLSISCRLNLRDFARAHEIAISSLQRDLHLIVDFNMWKNPYFYCLRVLVDNMALNRDKYKSIIPLDEEIDYYFDERSEKKLISDAWDETIERADENQKRYFGSAPRFENDCEFLPLQAADFWSWWVREWYEEDNSDVPDKMRGFDFGAWKGKRRPQIAINNRLDQIVDRLKRLAIENFALQDVTRTIETPHGY